MTGPGRPVTGTALTTALADGNGEELIYQYERLGGGETMNVGGSPPLEFRPGDLAPGASYRWRARVDDIADRASSRYTISLSGAQRRRLRKGTDIGTTTARMTRTGVRWTDLLSQLEQSAFFADEVAIEIGDESPRQDGIAYRRLLGELSVELGGPLHPRHLG